MRHAAQTVTVAGHFGEWVQGVLGPSGPVALVTLPCPALTLRLSFQPAATLTLDAGTPPVITEARFAEARAAFALPSEGAYRFTSALPPGGGAGASTAALVALARLAGVAEDTLLRRCNAIEGATDPLTLAAPDQHLWAPRTAKTLATLPAPPVFEIVGGFGPSPVWTKPDDQTFPDITDLLPAWRAACTAQDAEKTAKLATQSARETSRLRGAPLPGCDDLMADLGALGWVRAHTGSAVGFLFAPETAPKIAHAALTEAGLTDPLTFTTGAR